MSLLKYLFHVVGFVLVGFVAHGQTQNVVAELPGSLVVNNTGQANYSLPIDVPAGLAGMVPELAFEYNSSGGSGIMGVGWSLSGLDQISRSPRNYIFDGIVDGIDYDADDQLIMGEQRLVRVSGSEHLQDGAIYRKHVDDFSRVTAKGDSNGPTHFFVETKTGLIKTFGLNDNSSYILDNRAVIDNARMKWMLDEIRDANGNYIDYKYSYDSTTNEQLLESILYTGNQSAGIAPCSEIKFVYDQHTHNRSGYISGAKVQTKKRLSQVLCRSNNTLLWRYDLKYEDSSITRKSRLISVTKVLITESGEQALPTTQFVWRDVDPKDKWQNVSAQYKLQTMFHIRDVNTNKKRGFRFIDLNGDGLTDYVRSDTWIGSVSIDAKLNTGSGWQAAPQFNPPMRLNEEYGFDRGVRFMDLNGDGLVDMLKYHQYSSTNIRKGAWLNTGQTWNKAPDYIPPYPITASTDNPEAIDRGARFVDLNGDGLVDMLWHRHVSSSNQKIGAVLNTGSGWKDAPGYYSPYHFVNATGKDMGARLIDVNGDSLVDLVWNQSSSQQGARLNTGNGWALSNTPSFIPPVRLVTSGFGRRVKFTDINGDGLTDCLFACIDQGKGAWLNTGVRWVRADEYKVPYHYFGALEGVSYDWATLVDLNGDGIDDYSYGVYGLGRRAYINHHGTWVRDNRYDQKIYAGWAENVDLNGDGLVDQIGFHNDGSMQGAFLNKNSRPDLLAEVINGFGASTSLEYAPITDNTVYTKEADAAQLEAEFPVIEFTTPMWVVHTVATDAGVNNTTTGDPVIYHTNYRYAGARMHLQGLGFLGFRTFISHDEQTGLIKADILEQAPFFTGMKIGTKTYGANGQLLAYTSNTINAKMLNPYAVEENGIELTRYHTLFPYYQRTEEWKAEYIPNVDENHYWDMTDRELEDHFFTNTYAHSTITNDFDTFGNNIEINTDYGDDHRQLTENTYHNYTDASSFDAFGNRISGQWFLGRLSAATVTSTAPDATGQDETVIRSSAFTYDANGLLLSETVEPGNALAVTTTYSRDAQGRIVSTQVDPADGPAVTTETHSILDPTGRFYTRTANALGHTETRAYDTTRGWVDSQTGPNGRTTRFQYDALGRVLREDRPDGTWTATSYAFDTSQTVANPGNGLSATSVYSITTTASQAPSSTTWYDRLGRAIRACSEGYDGRIIYQDTGYNALGQVDCVSENYYAADGPTHWTKTTFDALGRVELVTTPDQTQLKTTYNGRETTTIRNFNGSDVDNPNPNANDQTTVTRLNAKGDLQTVTSYNQAQQALTIDYHYDGVGNLLETLTSSPTDGSRRISMSYDIRGNKTGMDDPDMGVWSYTYNALGQLTSQSDAANNLTTKTYDALGRILEEVYDAADPDLATVTHNYYYDGTGEHQQLGKLHLEKSSTGFRRSHYYDALGRSFLTLSKIEGRWFYQQTDYDGYSRPVRLTHYWRPPSLADNNQHRDYDHHLAWYSYSQETLYDTRSFVTEVRDANGQTWWSSPTYNQHGQMTSYLAGNGLRTTTEFNEANHVVERIFVTPTAAGSGNLLDHRYQFDSIGNLTQRTDAVKGLTEDLEYDNLNRLTSATVAGAGTVATTYDDLGNITNRTSTSGLGHVGAYQYVNGTNRVDNAGGRAYEYNANGSIIQVSGGSTGTIGWSAFNKPYTLEVNGKRSAFSYDTGNSRVTQTRQIVDANNPDTWINQSRKTYVGALFEQEQAWNATGSAWDITSTRVYISTPSGVVGSWIDNTAEAQPKQTFFHRDHLGSVIAESGGDLTAPAGYAQITQQFSYDAWGLARDATDWDGPPTGGAPERTATDRGYTGHEMLDELGLIHMNGRIYDPLLGRMLSADPHIQSPSNLQNYNRYSYVLNNPLSMTDPSGFFFDVIYNSIANFAASLFQPITILASFLTGGGSGGGVTTLVQTYQGVLQFSLAGTLLTVIVSSNPGALQIANGEMETGKGGSSTFVESFRKSVERVKEYTKTAARVVQKAKSTFVHWFSKSEPPNYKNENGAGTASYQSGFANGVVRRNKNVWAKDTWSRQPYKRPKRPSMANRNAGRQLTAKEFFGAAKSGAMEGLSSPQGKILSGTLAMLLSGGSASPWVASLGLSSGGLTAITGVGEGVAVFSGNSDSLEQFEYIPTSVLQMGGALFGEIFADDPRVGINTMRVAEGVLGVYQGVKDVDNMTDAFTLGLDVINLGADAQSVIERE